MYEHRGANVCVSLQELLEEVRKELQKVKDEIIGGKSLCRTVL